MAIPCYTTLTQIFPPTEPLLRACRYVGRPAGMAWRERAEAVGRCAVCANPPWTLDIATARLSVCLAPRYMPGAFLLKGTHSSRSSTCFSFVFFFLNQRSSPVLLLKRQDNNVCSGLLVRKGAELQPQGLLFEWKRRDLEWAAPFSCEFSFPPQRNLSHLLPVLASDFSITGQHLL